MLIREGIARLCPPEMVPTAYEMLRFFLAPGELDTTGHYIMVGLQVTSGTHIRLRDVLLCQPNFAHESPVTTLTWLEPPFAAPSAPNVLDTPRDQRTADEVADFLKSRFRPASSGGKKPQERTWVATCLTYESIEESTQIYPDREACASLYVAVDILTNYDGIRHSGFEGQFSSTERGLLVLIAYGLQHFLQASPPGHTGDLDALADLAYSFSFDDVRKRTLQSRFYSFLCDTASD